MIWFQSVLHKNWIWADSLNEVFNQGLFSKVVTFPSLPQWHHEFGPSCVSSQDSPGTRCLLPIRCCPFVPRQMYIWDAEASRVPRCGTAGRVTSQAAGRASSRQRALRVPGRSHHHRAKVHGASQYHPEHLADQTRSRSALLVCHRHWGFTSRRPPEPRNWADTSPWPPPAPWPPGFVREPHAETASHVLLAGPKRGL